MDSSTTITFFANAHRLTPGSSQPLHPRHEEYRSVLSVILRCCSPQVNLIYKDTCFSFTDKIDLGEQDLKVMLQNHREKRKRQPVRKGTWKYLCLCFHCLILDSFPQDHPDLMTSDIHLGDILSRTNIGRKGAVRE